MWPVKPYETGTGIKGVGVYVMAGLSSLTWPEGDLWTLGLG